LAEDVVKQGLRIDFMNLWRDGKLAARIPLGSFGQDISPFPYFLSFPQDEHEKLLIEYLEKTGVQVERGATLSGFNDENDFISAEVMTAAGKDKRQYSFVCGCDGAHSVVRKSMGQDFPGGTYKQIFYVADVEASGLMSGREPFFCLATGDICLVFPLPGKSNTRLIGIVPENITKDIEVITFNDVAEHVSRETSLEISKVNWFSAYHVHHRVAGKFQKGRTFLLGDAAHIHSPAGGQGMNTGIGDAVNLAWKISAVAKGQADPKLLETYAAERMAFAHQLVKSTDRLFLRHDEPIVIGADGARTFPAPNASCPTYKIRRKFFIQNRFPAYC
jgi:2-polyprenyl-6-methoxyphenol hydroxylase-like FAD-dependent oxidoreductase